MKKFLALSAVSAASLLTTPAAAQVLTGPRVEALIGYDNFKARFDDSDPDIVGIDGAFRPSDEAVVYGLGAGYDIGMGAFAVGVDVEATQSTGELRSFLSDDSGDYLLRTLVSRDLYAGVRGTFGIVESVNAYVKAGYSRVRVRGRLIDREDDSVLATESDKLGGWRVGAGLQFTNGWIYGGPEYRFTNYSSNDDFDAKRHQLVFVAGLNFGPRPAVIVPAPVVELPPPPPPAPATQTCPDGTVILATDACPVPPPPPPPPPAPAGERG